MGTFTSLPSWQAFGGYGSSFLNRGSDSDSITARAADADQGKAENERELAKLVRRRSLDVVDHEDVNLLLRGIQLEPKLFR